MPDTDATERTTILPRVALTGATGFVGRNIVEQLGGDRAEIRALARPHKSRVLNDGPRLHWVAGDLEQSGALTELCTGADVVIHCAGATKALRPRDFHRINVTATERLVKTACAANVRHFILLSSLAASRPAVSDYAASKAAGEAVATASAGEMRLTIVRAPAVIGPGDQATSPLFASMARGWIPVPGGKARNGLFSVIDVQDLAGLLIDIAFGGADAVPARILAPFGHGALGWPDMAASAGRVTGKRIREIVLPGPLLTVAGQGADILARLTGRAQVFSSGKVREMRAGDWIGETPLVTPTPMDVSMRRCLAPFLRLGNAPDNATVPIDRSPE